jgi:hypothetical protein
MSSILPVITPVTDTQRAVKRIDISLANASKALNNTLSTVGYALAVSRADSGGVLSKSEIVAEASPRYDNLDAFIAALAMAANIASGSPVPYAAPVITSASASNVSDSTATLNSIFGPGGLYTTAYYNYGVDTSYGSVTTKQTIAGDSDAMNIAHQLTGLVATTAYHYQLVLTNPLGTFTGEDQTFTTAASKSPDPSQPTPALKP